MRPKRGCAVFLAVFGLTEAVLIYVESPKLPPTVQRERTQLPGRSPGADRSVHSPALPPLHRRNRSPLPADTRQLLSPIPPAPKLQRSPQSYSHPPATPAECLQPYRSGRSSFPDSAKPLPTG